VENVIEEQKEGGREKLGYKILKKTLLETDLITWLILWMASLLIPLLTLMIFWKFTNPPSEVFLIFSGLYLIITLLLIRPLIFKKNGEEK
jgi:Na+(H+)/acetate symporter ActP